MPQVIDVPGYGPTEFPDGMSDEAIVAAIQKNMVKPQEKRSIVGRMIGSLRDSAESIIEPAATVVSGAIATPIAGFAGLAGDIYAGVTGGPRIGEEVANDVQKALTYQPRSRAAQSNLASIGSALEKSKLAGLPIAGQELSQIARTAGPAVRQAGNIAREEAAIAAQALPDVGGKLQRGAQNLMLNALKPTPKQYASGAADVAAQELLKRNISPNSKGVIAINARINELQNEVASAIKDSPATISKQAVLDRLVSVRDRFMRTANPESDLAAITAAEEGFAAHPLIPGETLPVQLAQEIKQGTYSEMRKKYGELGSAQTESQKALARGLKEEVASKVPDIAPLNAEESALFKTLDVVERRQFLEMNKDPVPLTGALRNPAAWAAITADKSSAFKSLLARLMYKTGKAIKGDTPTIPVPSAPTSRRIPINQDIPYAGLPNLGNPPVIPGSWREGMMTREGQTPLPALSENLLPIAERYQGTNIPIGTIESGGPVQPRTPLPSLPPQGRGMLSLEEPNAPVLQRSGQPAWQKPLGVDFPLRQEVLQQLEPQVTAFRKEAARLQAIIDNKYPITGKPQAEARMQLKKLQEEFAAGMRQLGIDTPQEAIGLQKLYQGREGTKLPIQHGFSGMMTP